MRPLGLLGDIRPRGFRREGGVRAPEGRGALARCWCSSHSLRPQVSAGPGSQRPQRAPTVGGTRPGLSVRDRFYAAGGASRQSVRSWDAASPQSIRTRPPSDARGWGEDPGPVPRHGQSMALRPYDLRDQGRGLLPSGTARGSAAASSSYTYCTWFTCFIWLRAIAATQS
jgi:hypothetical protein